MKTTIEKSDRYTLVMSKLEKFTILQSKINKNVKPN
jgi:hypothetical protein